MSNRLACVFSSNVIKYLHHDNEGDQNIYYDDCDDGDFDITICSAHQLKLFQRTV